MTGPLRAVLLTLVAALACTSGSANRGLAADQTLTFPIEADVEHLDPAHASSATDIAFVRELFGGLYRYDDHLNVVQDIATGSPEVSADGLTYVFRLHPDARFANGDAIGADDFIFSWNRAAAANDAFASIFDPVVGSADVQAGRARAMAGLSKRDEHTLVAQLSEPAGYWTGQLALWPAAVVNRKVTGPGSDEAWASDPQTLIGSGPFRMVERIPHRSMEFAPVPGWWKGPTGRLQRVRVEVGVDPATAVRRYEGGAYDLVGPANNPPPAEDLVRLRSDPARAAEVHLHPGASSTWLGFDFKSGPFRGLAEGRELRQAVVRGIDRVQLAEVACVKASTCAPATGGPLPAGLHGHLGENAAAAARFDPGAGRALLQKADPDGSRTRDLKLRYAGGTASTRLLTVVAAQLRANLGLKVELVPSDLPALASDHRAGSASLFRDHWAAYYDHPQDWFDNLWTCPGGVPARANSGGYCNPRVDALAARGRAEPADRALATYIEAQRLLLDDAQAATLVYGTQPYLVHQHIRGAGFNGLFDSSWTGLSVWRAP